MKVAGLKYSRIDVQTATVPQYDPEVKVEDGVVFVRAVFPNGEKAWIRADALRSGREEAERRFQVLMWRLRDAADDLGMSKAEVKRRLINEGILSK